VKKRRRFFQLGKESFTPFNDAPAFLHGKLQWGDEDSLSLEGTAKYYLNDWYKIGCTTDTLRAPQSFGFSVDVTPVNPIGSYGIGIRGEASIYVSHFLKSSGTLNEEYLLENAYSAFGFDNYGGRTQVGIPAPWKMLNTANHLGVGYDSSSKLLTAYVNGFPVHQIPGTLGECHLQIRYESVGVAGAFSVQFENLRFSPQGSDVSEVVECLAAWDPSFAPVFVSYSHVDATRTRELVKELSLEGVRVLGDWQFQGGDSLIARISESILRAGYLLVMLSPASVQSEWVRRELEIASAGELSENRICVVPVLLEDCPIPAFLRGKLYLDARSSYPIEELLQQLHKYEW